jgi:hypothetical protein
MIKKVNADYQNDGPFSSSFTGLNLQSEGARERERERRARNLKIFPSYIGPLETLPLSPLINHFTNCKSLG